MAELFGNTYDRAGLMRRVGNLNQVAGIREYTYNSGRADGVKAISVNTGPLSFEVLVSRCLDISYLNYKGVPLGYMSKSGIGHPAYYNKVDNTSFHDNFFAGAVSTCGLHNIGPDSEYLGRTYHLHGDVGNLPAEKVSVSETWDGDDCVFTVSGEIHHSKFYNGDLILRRRITARLGSSSLLIEDEVENLDFAPALCLIMYHCQFGFPILGKTTRLMTSPARGIVARPGVPADAVQQCASFADPKDGENEQCFYHDLQPDAKGRITACLFNPDLGGKGLGAFVRSTADTLPIMLQWKMLRSREYVCGLEPCSAHLDGRSDEELAANTLQPLQKRSFSMEIGCVEGEDGFRALHQ